MTDRGITWATFDCYGTLVDWEGGMASFLYAIALRSGDEAPPSGNALRVEWEAIQFDLIQGAYKSYKDVLAESVRAWCERRGYAWSEGYADAVVMSMRAFQPFHDTVPALTRARKAGLNLAIISNTDHDIINHSLNHMGIEFDEVITAEDCRAYKPAPMVFEQALDQIGVPAEHMLHVAFGFKYDIGPAQQFGWKTAWVNRNAERLTGDVQPDHIWRDLWGLAAFAGEPYDLEKP
jgi:2-haloalkanoic acid dehalogenase type II